MRTLAATISALLLFSNPTSTVPHVSILRVMAMPEVAERIRGIGQTSAPADADEFSKLIRAEHARWGQVVKASGARVE